MTSMGLTRKQSFSHFPCEINSRRAHKYSTFCPVFLKWNTFALHEKHLSQRQDYPLLSSRQVHDSSKIWQGKSLCSWQGKYKFFPCVFMKWLGRYDNWGKQKTDQDWQEHDDYQDRSYQDGNYDRDEEDIPTVMNIKIEEIMKTIDKKVIKPVKTTVKDLIKDFIKTRRHQRSQHGDDDSSKIDGWVRNRTPVEEDYKSCISWMTDWKTDKS